MDFEVELIKFLQSGLSTNWISVFQVVTLLGSWLGFLISFIIIFRKRKIMACFMVIGFVAAIAINFAIKNIVCRARPFESFDFIVNYGNEGGFSMPSGHSCAVAVMAVFLIAYIFQISLNNTSKILGTVAVILLSLLVGFSRMVLGVHYLTDVLVGLLEGAIIASILLLIYYHYIYKVQKQVDMLKAMLKGDEDE